MNKKERQLARIEAALTVVMRFETCAPTLIGALCDELRNGYNTERDSILSFTPTPSTEYKLIPPHEMAELMDTKGLTLEFPPAKSSMVASFDFSASQFITHKVGCGNAATPLLNWGIPCRIYQPPKKETRWLWRYDDGDCIVETKGKSATQPIGRAPVWKKVEESAEDFVIEGAE